MSTDPERPVPVAPAVRRPRLAIAPAAILTIVVTIVLTLPACTGMLVGGGGGGAGPPLGSDTRTAADAAADDRLSAEVRRRLLADPAVGRYPLRVRATNRRVALSGTVASYAVRDRAAGVARDTDGVLSVDNRIRVDTRMDEY